MESDGIKYVSEFKDGRVHGQGTRTFPNGEKYEGEWENDREHGQGTRTFTMGASMKVNLITVGCMVKEY